MEIALHSVCLKSGESAAVYHHPTIACQFRPMVGDQWLIMSGLMSQVNRVVWHPHNGRLLVDVGDEFDVTDKLESGTTWTSIHERMVAAGWFLDVDDDDLPDELQSLAD